MEMDFYERIRMHSLSAKILLTKELSKSQISKGKFE